MTRDLTWMQGLIKQCAVRGIQPEALLASSGINDSRTLTLLKVAQAATLADIKGVDDLKNLKRDAVTNKSTAVSPAVQMIPGTAIPVPAKPAPMRPGTDLTALKVGPGQVRSGLPKELTDPIAIGRDEFGNTIGYKDKVDPDLQRKLTELSAQYNAGLRNPESVTDTVGNYLGYGWNKLKDWGGKLFGLPENSAADYEARKLQERRMQEYMAAQRYMQLRGLPLFENPNDYWAAVGKPLDRGALAAQQKQIKYEQVMKAKQEEARKEWQQRMNDYYMSTMPATWKKASVKKAQLAWNLTPASQPQQSGGGFKLPQLGTTHADWQQFVRGNNKAQPTQSQRPGLTLQDIGAGARTASNFGPAPMFRTLSGMRNVAGNTLRAAPRPVADFSKVTAMAGPAVIPNRPIGRRVAPQNQYATRSINGQDYYMVPSDQWTDAGSAAGNNITNRTMTMGGRNFTLVPRAPTPAPVATPASTPSAPVMPPVTTAPQINTVPQRVSASTPKPLAMPDLTAAMQTGNQSYIPSGALQRLGGGGVPPAPESNYVGIRPDLLAKYNTPEINARYKEMQIQNAARAATKQGAARNRFSGLNHLTKL